MRIRIPQQFLLRLNIKELSKWMFDRGGGGGRGLILNIRGFQLPVAFLLLLLISWPGWWSMGLGALIMFSTESSFSSTIPDQSSETQSMFEISIIVRQPNQSSEIQSKFGNQIKVRKPNQSSETQSKFGHWIKVRSLNQSSDTEPKFGQCNQSSDIPKIGHPIKVRTLSNWINVRTMFR